MKNDVSAPLAEMFAAAFSGEKQGEILSRDVLIENENYVYQAYLPPPLEKSESLPLIVFLHGIRERGSGGFITGMFATIAKQYLKQLPAVILLPQCRPNKYWNDAQMDKMVIGEIEDMTKDFSIDANRKYLIGVSMGGYGVWHFGSQYPNDFAALVSICGGSHLTTGNRFAPVAESVGKTPSWLFHGSEDQIVQVSESRNLAAAIRKNGGSVKYSEYENVGHNVWLNALGEKELLPWILAQRKD